MLLGVQNTVYSSTTERRVRLLHYRLILSCLLPHSSERRTERHFNSHERKQQKIDE